jgi:hypothetical protein
VDFGAIFVGCLYEKTLTLRNDTDLPAKYELILQEEATNTLYSYYADQPEGEIVEYSYKQKQVKLFFMPKKVGLVSVPVNFRIKGSRQLPLEVCLIASVSGPIVNLEFQKEKLAFGRIPVLTKIAKTLKLNNESPIPASFRASIKGKDKFTVEPREGTIMPHQSVPLTISV